MVGYLGYFGHRPFSACFHVRVRVWVVIRGRPSFDWLRVDAEITVREEEGSGGRFTLRLWTPQVVSSAMGPSGAEGALEGAQDFV